MDDDGAVAVGTGRPSIAWGNHSLCFSQGQELCSGPAPG